jgi:hypothetical protein
VVGAVLEKLDEMYETAVDDPVSAGFAAWVRELLEPHRKRVGNVAAPKEAVQVALLRPGLLYALATWGQDAKLTKLAATKLEGYFADPNSLSSEELANWLPIVTLSGDAELWEKLRARLPFAVNPSERRLLVSGLGHFEDPALAVKSLELVLDGQLRGQDFRVLVSAMRPSARLAALTWLPAHYDSLLAQIGDKTAPRLPDLGHSLCTEEGRARLEKTFTSLPNPPSGLDRNLNLTLEEVERCVRRKEYLKGAVSARFAAKR